MGNKESRGEFDAVFGQIGWMRTDLRSSDRYNMAERRWEDVIEDAEVSARAPFVIDTRSRLLGVLQHRSFRPPKNIAYVFQTLLRQGENGRADASTEWSVEPILDTAEFSEWLRRVDAVDRIRMVAKLPNPDALPEFGPVWQRMQAHKAKLLSEAMEAADPALGLQGLGEDEQVRAFLAMGANGVSYLVADGHEGGRRRTFDQRERVAREHTGDLAPSWSEVFRTILGMIRGRR